MFLKCGGYSGLACNSPLQLPFTYLSVLQKQESLKHFLVSVRDVIEDKAITCTCARFGEWK